MKNLTNVSETFLGSMFPGKVRLAYGNRIRELYGKNEQLTTTGSDTIRSGPLTTPITDDYTYQTSDPESPRSIRPNINRKHNFMPHERVSLVGNKRVSFAE